MDNCAGIIIADSNVQAARAGQRLLAAAAEVHMDMSGGASVDAAPHWTSQAFVMLLITPRSTTLSHRLLQLIMWPAD
jgi:hypothetical protein